jgi:hypothetical protein
MATDKTMVEVHTAHMSGQHQAEAAAEATAAGAASGHKPEKFTGSEIVMSL